MRTRVLLVGLVIAATVLVVGTAPAGADEGDVEQVKTQVEQLTEDLNGLSEEDRALLSEELEEAADDNDATHEDKECIATLVEGGSVDDCHEAPSPILPPINELIWGSLSFVIILVLLAKLAYPGIKKGMDGRTERIRTDLERAEGAKAEAEGVLSEYQNQLSDARNESARIIEEARQTADQVRSERIAAIDGEIAEMRQRAAADVESSKAQAIADLRGEVTSLALGAAERVVRRNLDDETNRALIDDYIEQVGGVTLMNQERIAAYADAFYAVIGAEDNLGEVDDELFRFARVLEGNEELLDALDDPHLAPAQRQQIVVDLLGGKARPITVSLVSMLVGNGRVRQLPAIVDTLVALSAASREKAVAEVRSTVELTDDQVSRLAGALSRATGKSIEVKVIIDPTVQGGLVAQVGDTVIDGSVRRRLEQLRAAL